MPRRPPILGWLGRHPHRRWLILGTLGALLFLMVFVPFAVRVHALAARHAVGPSWKFPSRVYSDHVELVAGRVLPKRYLIDELAARGYERVPAPVTTPGAYAITPEGLEIFVRGFADDPVLGGNGGPERVALALDDSMLVRVDRLHGLPGARDPDREHPPRLEPVLVSLLLDDELIRRSYVTLDRVPKVVQDAVVATEDRRFYYHLGVDLWASLRAIRRNLRSHGIREGGSTITQQLARGLFLGRERTWSRKLAEMPIAVGLEVLLGKKRILEMYLNMIYWGQAQGGGVGGIAEASRWYFDVPVESLRVEQGALLAGIIRAPNTIAPFEYPDRALAKRNEVLKDMAAAHVLDRAEAERLETLPLGLRQGAAPNQLYPSYTGYVRQVLTRRFGEHAPEAWGLTVWTTMDLAFQQAAERELARGISSLEGGGRRRPPLEGAFVALEPVTDAVRAVVGGRDTDPGEFNRATQARRQTGSAIKPVVYAAALSQGGFTPATTVPNERRSFGSGKWAWTPRNDGDFYTPTVTLACALARSLNVATANVVELIGPGAVARMAEQLGLGQLKPVMSIGLGTNEASLIDLTNAFAVFANGGTRRGATPIKKVVDSRRQVILEPPTGSEQVLPTAIADLVTGLLEDVVKYGVAYPLRAYYGFDRPVAGKTGTTNKFYDAWFVGYTPYLIAGVWIGYDRPRSIGRQAAHSALPVWASIMTSLVGSFPKTPFQSDIGLEYHAIEPWNGSLADDGGCASMWVPFLHGTAPTLSCTTISDTLYLGESLDSLGYYVEDSTEVGTEETFADTDFVVEPDTTEAP